VRSGTIVEKVIHTPLPLLLMKDTNNHTSAADVTEEIYLYNTTDSTFDVKAKSAFFTTVDDETGEGLTHGARPATKLFPPEEIMKVGDVAGWEWDSVLSFSVDFINEETDISVKYDLKISKKARTFPNLGEARPVCATFFFVRRLK
jgi:hypothetical protein